MAELLQEKGQSMAEQVACVDTLLSAAPVRNLHKPLTRCGRHYKSSGLCADSCT